MQNKFIIAPTIKEALNKKEPVVALESAVITHGLPRPINIETAIEMEEAVLKNGAHPATIGILNGKIHIGLSYEEIRLLGTIEGSVKISLRNIAGAIVKSQFGGTTVSATMIIAKQAGIKTFATGGIGGVHRGNPFDISADLPTLASTPMVVVCAGVKAILDLPSTMEVLETSGVPVIGYQTGKLPAFYSDSSGLFVDYQLDNAKEISDFSQNHWDLGLKTAVLVTVPLPGEYSLDSEYLEEKINQALEKAAKMNIKGSAITPFLLNEVSKSTKEKSLKANRSLLINNAIIAAQIAENLSNI